MFAFGQTDLTLAQATQLLVEQHPGLTDDLVIGHAPLGDQIQLILQLAGKIQIGKGKGAHQRIPDELAGR